MTTVSFPGLNIEEFELNPAAISFGESFVVYWYALFIVFGFAAAVLYAWYRSRREQIKLDDLLDVTLFSTVFGIIGARIFYVLFSPTPINGFLDAIAIWDGGISMQGAILFGAITAFVVCRLKSVPVLKMLDVCAPALMLAQAIGAIGNFFNGEAYGTIIPKSNLFYFLRMGISPHIFEDIEGLAFVHPLFIYECVWYLLSFALMHFTFKKKKFDAQIILVYLTCYGFGQLFIESQRLDSLKIGVFKLSTVLGLICLVAGALSLIYNLTKANRKQKDSEEYIPSYKKMSKPASLFTEENTVEDDYTPSFNFASGQDGDESYEENNDENEEKENGTDN